MSRKLVTYFSASGVTAKVAETLAEAIGADIYEIEPAAPYSKADLDWTNQKSRSSVEMSDPTSRPAIAGKRDNMDDYDTVFVGFPIWWYVAPHIINTFLESYDLTGKTIIPFATSGGSGMGKTNERLALSCKGAKLIEGKVFNHSTSHEELAAWVDNHLIFNAVDFVDHHAYKSYKKIYYDMREVSDRLCKENGLSVIPPSQGKGMSYKEYTEAKRGTSWKQKLKLTIDRNIIVAKDYDEFLKLMQDAGYEIKTGKYISFRAEGQERFTRAKTIGENYSEERIKERIQGHNPRKRQMQTTRKGVSLIIDIQNSIKAQESKGYEHWAKINNLKEAAKTLNYLTENNLLQYADLEKKVEDIHRSYARTGDDLKQIEARLRKVQPLIKNIANYRKLKPVYDAYMKAKDKSAFRAKHEAELVIFEAAKTTLLAMQGDQKLPSLKALQAEQQRITDEQQRLYDERARLKREMKQIDTIKANVDMLLRIDEDQEQRQERSPQRE